MAFAGVPKILLFTLKMQWSEKFEGGITRVRCDGEPHAYIATSTLISGEEGLFADRTFRPGDTVSVFKGTALPSDTKVISRYVVEVVRRRKVLLDCESSGAPYAHKINDSRNTGIRSNCRILQSGRLICTRLTQPGAEFLTSYGPAYWRLHGAAAQGAA